MEDYYSIARMWWFCKKSTWFWLYKMLSGLPEKCRSTLAECHIFTCNMFPASAACILHLVSCIPSSSVFGLSFDAAGSVPSGKSVTYFPHHPIMGRPRTNPGQMREKAVCSLSGAPEIPSLLEEVGEEHVPLLQIEVSSFS